MAFIVRQRACRGKDNDRAIKRQTKSKNRLSSYQFSVRRRRT